MLVVSYARVSTKEQDISLQRKEISKHCEYKNLRILRSFEDIGKSGKNMDRPAFIQLMELIKANPEIKAVIIWKLDRIGRSVKDLITIIETLKSLNIDLISITDNIDTTTTSGRLLFHITSAFAEYEREILSERSKLGREKALEQGTICNRPKIILDKEFVMKLYNMGVPKTTIALKIGVSEGTIHNRISEWERDI